MSELRIITNHHRREWVYGYELPHYGLSEDEIAQMKSDYNWVDDFDTCRFVHYKNHWHCEYDFMYTTGRYAGLQEGSPLIEWDGYNPDSFFSGTLMRYPRQDWNPKEIDTEFVIMGWYCS